MANFNFNKTILGGRLTADPELKYTGNNIPVTSFSLAIKRKGAKEDTTDFINVVAWRNTAEFICKYFGKGSSICITGSIQTRKYEEKDTGKTRTAFEVIAESADFVDSKADNTFPAEAGKAPQSANSATFSGNNNDFTEINTNDDDLPF